MRFLLVVLLFGCGGAGVAAELKCAPRSGAYRVSYALRDGNCGAFVDQTTLVDDTTQPADRGCTGELVTSEDGCEVVSERFDCGGVSWTGAIQWDATASLGAGTVTHEVNMPGYTCRGTYDVVYANRPAGEPKS